MSPRRGVFGVFGRQIVVQLALSTCLVASAAAQTTSPPPASEPEPKDDAAVRPIEPDFKVINLPTTLPLPIHGANFGLTHRFAGNLRVGSFGDQLNDLFGLDEGATIGLEFRYGVIRGVQAVFLRTNFDKTIQFSGKWDALRQEGSSPVAISGLLSVEGSDNFRKRREPAIGAVIAHNHRDRLAVYATPVWVHDTGAEAGVRQDTFFIGLAARARLGENTFLVGEVSPRVSGYAPGDPEYGFGIEKRVGGHTFQLNFTNTFGTTFGQTARGGYPDTLYLGFNLARKFF